MIEKERNQMMRMMPTPTLQQPAMESRIRCRSASASTEAEAEFCNSEDFGKRTKWQRKCF